MIYITGDCHGDFRRFNKKYFEELRQTVKFKKWIFGHYHGNKNVTADEILIYEQIVRIS